MRTLDDDEGRLSHLFVLIRRRLSIVKAMMTAVTVRQYFLFIRALPHWHSFVLLVNSTIDKRAVITTVTTSKQIKIDIQLFYISGKYIYVFACILRTTLFALFNA
jgi:hypothetical protein